MLAYHGEQATKDKYLERVKQHREADELIQGYGYWDDGKGCAVGCTLHKGELPHRHYESELGIPERIAHLEDAIFEGLSEELAKQWPERFLSAIPPGADLSLVWHHFAVWLLRDSKLLTITDVNREAIAAVLMLHVRAANGDQPSGSDWSAAESAAESAAWSARSAAESAAYQKMADKLVELLESAPASGREGG